MNKRLMTTTLMLLLFVVCFSQENSVSAKSSPYNPLPKFRQEMLQLIHNTKFPYRDYYFSYNIRYDTLSSQYKFSTRDQVIQESIGEKMDSLIQASDLEKSAYHKYRSGYSGIVKFDSYTDKIFVGIESAGKLINIIHVGAQAQGGTEAFVKRWIAYLDSLQTAGKSLIPTTEPQHERWGYVMIETDGSLVLTDTTSYYNRLLKEFLAQEKKWLPTIWYTRPIKSIVRLRITPIYKRYIPTSSWTLKRFYKVEKIAYTIDNRNIYIAEAEDFKDIPDNSHVISVVNYLNQYTAPVIHRGKPEEYNWLIEILQNRVALDKWKFRLHGFRRIYFYTD